MAVKIKEFLQETDLWDGTKEEEFDQVILETKLLAKTTKKNIQKESDGFDQKPHDIHSLNDIDSNISSSSNSENDENDEDSDDDFSYKNKFKKTNYRGLGNPK